MVIPTRLGAPSAASFALADCLDVGRRVGLDGVEGEPFALAAVLDPGGTKVGEDRLLERSVVADAASALSAFRAPELSTALPANASERCGDRLSTVNGPETRTFFGSS